MPRGVVEKLIVSHLADGRPEIGTEIRLKIDQTLTQDATGTMAYLQYEAIGAGSVATELSVSYVDHNTVQAGFENADDHEYLRTVAAKFGVKYSRAGNGICHQVHLERFGKPGKTLLGSDSHTPTGGGIGMFALGAGGLDVALAMAGTPFSIAYPKIYLVNLKGRLRPWVAAKDVILWLLSELSSKGNVGVCIEYGGEGVGTLAVPERATIANMGAELGVTTSVFPSDEVTREFLAAQGRADDYVWLTADKGAGYARVIDLDLGALGPLVAAPHNPDNIRPVAEFAGKKVDQVCIGSCTNSSYKDLTIAAKMLEGKKVAAGTSVVVAPGSRQVLEMIAADGALATLIGAGVRIAESTCGFCIGNSQAPRSGAVSIRTSNRNFLGRSGTKDAGIYLTSVETAVASAIAGQFVDPTTLGDAAFPKITQPKKFHIDDSMVIDPPAESARGGIEIYRGPNIGAPPRNTPLPDRIRGRVELKVGDKITTDHIMPAGAFLKYRSNVPKYSEYVFYPVDEQFSARCREAQGRGAANFVVAGESYGQGSSREHAALCPMYLGVKAIIAKSFERIHTANLINFGIMPLVFEAPADYDALEQGDEIEFAALHRGVDAGRLVLRNLTRNSEVGLVLNLTEGQRRMIKAGGTLNLVKENV